MTATDHYMEQANFLIIVISKELESNEIQAQFINTCLIPMAPILINNDAKDYIWKESKLSGLQNNYLFCRWISFADFSAWVGHIGCSSLIPAARRVVFMDPMQKKKTPIGRKQKQNAAAWSQFVIRKFF